MSKTVYQGCELKQAELGHFSELELIPCELELEFDVIGLVRSSG